jgi:hypothetical protein
VIILIVSIQPRGSRIELLTSRAAPGLIPVERGGEESGLRFQGPNRDENRDKENPGALKS